MLALTNSRNRRLSRAALLAPRGLRDSSSALKKPSRFASFGLPAKPLTNPAGLSFYRAALSTSRGRSPGCRGIRLGNATRRLGSPAVLSPGHGVANSCRAPLLPSRGTLFFCRGFLFTTTYAESASPPAVTDRTSPTSDTQPRNTGNTRKPTSGSRLPRLSRFIPPFHFVTSNPQPSTP